MDPRLRSRINSNVHNISKAITDNNQMANYYRQTSYRRRYSRYGRKRSSIRGSARGEFRAGLQQRDTARQCLKWSNVQPIKIAESANQGAVRFNAWQALKNSGFFNNFAQMYDQIRLNGIRIKITLLSATTSIYSATNNPVFVSAWDRNGTATGAGGLTFSEVSSYGSALTRPLTQGANFGVTRYLYASTMAEKSQYVATSDLDSIIGDYEVDGSEANAFKPILLMAIYSASTTTAQQELKFNIEWTFDVTFRGTRHDPDAILSS